VIVGFPGESEADFQATCAVAREVGFSKIHIFPFSARRGTPAAELPDPIDKPTIVDRGRRLAEIERELRHAYFNRLVGRRLRVLIEAVENDPTAGSFRQRGTSCRYAPVEISGRSDTRGQLIDVIAEKALDDRILARAAVPTACSPA
jgi:threonylcarbamoyladenosine tRNA methylthiotransferase MtaB